MVSATEEVEMPQKQTIPEYLDMPQATYDEIMQKYGSGITGKTALFSEFLFQHPYPRWELIVELLKILEGKGEARAGLAQEVEEKYLPCKYNYTSMKNIFQKCRGM